MSQLHWTGRLGKPILFIILTLIAVGAYLATSIPVSVFPNTNFPRIVVGIENGVMPINQMEVTITRPIEEAMNTVPGLDRVISTTSRGSAEIDLFFNWNIDMAQTLNLVNAALASAQTSIPSTAHVTATRLTFAAFPILGYSVTSSTLPQTKLWELVNYTIKPRLNRLEGVSNVIVQGGQIPEFQIEPDPAKLVQTQATVPGILDAVSKGNLLDSPGLLESQHQLVLALVSGQATSPAQIADIVVKVSPGGIPIRIGDVATVSSSAMPVYTMVTSEGKPAVLFNVFRQPQSNTAKVADEVKNELPSIERGFPGGVKIVPFYDQSNVVNASIASVRDAILIGLILAAVILVLFLRDWGSSLVAGLVIPATVAITCIGLSLTGQSFNLMTLGGLAAAVGLVIDDAIVVVENIILHGQSGLSRSDAIRRALQEIRIPLVGSTITPIVVFLPLITITGVTGTFFRALAVTVAIALLTSLALALTWTPALSHYFLETKQKEDEGPSRSIRIYARMLNTVVDRPWLLAIFGVALVTASFFCYRSIGSDLLPSIDEGGFILDYLMPAGSSLEETNRVMSGVENILAKVPEVQSTSRRTGLQLGLATVTEANNGDVAVLLKKDRHRSAEEVIADVRRQITTKYPQLDVDFPQLLQDMIGDLTSSPDPIQIKLFSPDPNLLRRWAPQVGEAIKKIHGVVDVKNGIENTISGPAVVFSVDPVVVARAGFTPQEVELDASAILQGEPAATPIVSNDRSYTLRVRFPPSTRASLESVQNTVLISSTGRTATLGTLAKLENQPGQTQILRENLQRVVAVTGRLEGMSLGTGISEVQHVVDRLHIPSSIRVVYGGAYAEQQKSFHDLALVLILAVVLVFGVLLLEFHTFSAPLAILASSLLSTSGVFFALLVTGTTFNLSSFMGLIMVIGIVAKNGILLLDADQRFQAEGSSPRQAMIQAGERRLRPILMTVLATLAGMIPLSLAIGAGSQLLQPLAIAVIGGVFTSLVVSLIVTPAIHYFASGRR